MLGLITQRQILNEYGNYCDQLEKEYIEFFQKLNIELTPVSNFQNIKIKNADILILSGGGNINKEQIGRDKIEELLFKEALKKQIPIIGICRGMQYINILLGGSISENAQLTVKRPNKIDHPIEIFNKTIKVNNFHNNVIFKNSLSKELEIIGMDTENNTVEAFYSNKKILGLQWHPERNFEDEYSNNFSTNLVKNFIINKGEIDESCYISCR